MRHPSKKVDSNIVKQFVITAVRFGGLLSTILVVLMMALVAFAVFKRYAIGHPLLWGDELLGYFLVAFVMFGTAEALRKDAHIAVDILSQRLTGGRKKALDIFSDLAVFAFSIVLIVSTWQTIEFAYGFGSYSPGYLEMQTWIPQIPILIGSILMGAMALVRIVQKYYTKVTR